MKKLIILLIAVTVILTSCTPVPEPYSKTDFYLGTVVTLIIYDKNAEELMDGAMLEIERLENLLSGNIEESDISRINSAAGIETVEVSAETHEVITKGIEYYETSSGLFDISIGPLVDLWGIGTTNARVPTQDEINIAMANIDIDAIISDGKRVILLNEGMKIEVGGIAKGYIADRVAEYLKENGCDGAIINLGGNVLTVGEKPDGTKWRIGIQNPFEPTGTYIRVVEVEEMSVVTSGSYERFFTEDGITYHHILDPNTGYPVETDIAGVSIISSKSVDGDGLSTTVFALGYEKGISLIELISGVECIIILKDGNIQYSSGIAEFLD
jgi:thiamine biosynthesis lipoprotein